MRSPDITSVDYQFNEPPNQPEELPKYLYSEFIKIKAAIDLLADGHIDKTFAAPARPRNGDIRYADGTTWNPGSGEGIYFYNTAGSWVKL